MVPVRLKRSKLSEIREQNIERTYAHKQLYTDYNGHQDVQMNFPVSPKNANLISSKTTDGFHAPVLDIDFPVDLIPSRTEGHYHLYLNKKMTWEQYKKLLTVLIEVGVIEENWVTMNLGYGATFVRTPVEEIKGLFGVDDEEEKFHDGGWIS